MIPQETRGLYGAQELRPDKIVAYCSRHHRAMTAAQMKKKQCLAKHCWHMVPEERHPYWAAREKTKQLRKERKARLREELARYGGDNAD